NCLISSLSSNLTIIASWATAAPESNVKPRRPAFQFIIPHSFVISLKQIKMVGSCKLKITLEGRRLTYLARDGGSLLGKAQACLLRNQASSYFALKILSNENPGCFDCKYQVQS